MKRNEFRYDSRPYDFSRWTKAQGSGVFVEGVYHQPWFGPELLPPPQVNELSAEIRRNLFVQGMVSLYKPDEKTIERVQKAIDRCWYLFPAEIMGPNHPPIVAAYMFDEAKCRDGFETADGMASWFTMNGQDGYSVIGIGKAAVEYGDPNYLQLVILHEFAHTFGIDPYTIHGPFFYAKLDEMILNYNRVYGTSLKSDYVGYNDEVGNHIV